MDTLSRDELDDKQKSGLWEDECVSLSSGNVDDSDDAADEEIKALEDSFKEQLSTSEFDTRE